jgi:hypothetical protein
MGYLNWHRSFQHRLLPKPLFSSLVYCHRPPAGGGSSTAHTMYFRPKAPSDVMFHRVRLANQGSYYQEFTAATHRDMAIDFSETNIRILNSEMNWIPCHNKMRKEKNSAVFLPETTQRAHCNYRSHTAQMSMELTAQHVRDHVAQQGRRRQRECLPWATERPRRGDRTKV